RAGDVALIWDDDLFADRTRACVQATPARLETISFREHAAPAVYLKDAKLWLHLDPSTEPELICPVDDLLIHGRHNVCNALFAAGLVARFGLTAAEIAAGLKTFTAPPHRLELVAEIAGVRYFDDSKATNPDSVRAALTAFAPATVHLLLGGQGKGTPYEDLARSALACARAVYTFGAEGPVLAETFRAIQAQGAVAPSLTACGDLEEAFAAAAEAARPGEAVLLSPACASFDAFDSYAQRGEFFVALVRAQARAGREGPL
ncbi:MAG: UDP-N-acetylmuramoyl-L-alanine--D-glutamate ligase, partial [Actinomycetia bacterium]|nr:UDP-N-acetylmuramoyl-L-alanine--D-glutamate ligase [Actinomycetes bacterium]